VNEPPHVLSPSVFNLNENVTVGTLFYTFDTFDEEQQFVNHTIVRTCHMGVPSVFVECPGGVWRS
jgi:hypothetical protein